MSSLSTRSGRQPAHHEVCQIYCTTSPQSSQRNQHESQTVFARGIQKASIPPSPNSPQGFPDHARNPPTTQALKYHAVSSRLQRKSFNPARPTARRIHANNSRSGQRAPERQHIRSPADHPKIGGPRSATRGPKRGPEERSRGPEDEGARTADDDAGDADASGPQQGILKTEEGSWRFWASYAWVGFGVRG